MQTQAHWRPIRRPVDCRSRGYKAHCAVADADFRAYRLNSLAVESLTNWLVRIVYAGDPSLSYIVERSTNFLNWTQSTNTADTNGLIEIIESGAGTTAPQFFRARH